MGTITFYDEIKRSEISEEQLKYTNVKSQILENKVSGGGIMSYVNEEEFKQFDKRITDSLNNINIDTNKIKSIDEKVHTLNLDVSTVKSDVDNMQTKFDTSLSSVKTSVDSIDNNISNILDAKFESLEGKLDRKISNIQWVTGLSSLAIIIAILLA